MSEQAHIDCLAFAQDARQMESVVAVRDFTRLCKSLADDAGEIRYRIAGGREESGRAFMRLEASGRLQLQCQRCMQDFDWDLVTNSLVYIARNVVELELWDRQADGLEDAVLADSQFEWFAWLEDELLLSLPAAPIHRAEICPTDRATQKASRPNPFAVLATLKQHQKLKS